MNTFKDYFLRRIISQKSKGLQELKFWPFGVSAERSVHYFFRVPYFPPRRGCPRVQGVLSHKRIRFGLSKKLGTPQTCAPKHSAGVDGGRKEGQACGDPGARTPIGTSGIFFFCLNARKKLNFHLFPNLALFSCTVQTDGQVHYKCTEAGIPNIRAEQSVCTSLDENAITHSILIKTT
jgi:hypothetical protein